jgi:hypothetical protein
VDTQQGAGEAPLGPALERLAALQTALEAHAQDLAQPPPAGAAPAIGVPEAAGALPLVAAPAGRRWPPAVPQGTRRWLVPGAVALTLGVGLLWWYLATPRVPEALPGVLVRAQEPTVVGLQGDVLVWRAGAREATAARGAVVVGTDDRVQTGPGGRATIAWPRGAVATLDGQSAIMLLPSAADDVVRVQLMEGSLWLDGGAESSALTVEAFTPDGARVSGRRFQAQRDGAGRLSVATTDAGATVAANDGRQELPPGSTSEVLVGRQPALPRPAFVPPAVAVVVEGPAGWVIVDRLGRAVGQAPDGGGWIDQIPAVRGPLPRERGAAAILPDPAGEYQVLLWGSEAIRPYRVALWPTDGQALFGGTAPSEPSGALRQDGEIPAGGRVALRFTVQGETIALAEPARPLAALPEWLRAAIPAGPRLAAAPSATAAPSPPAARQFIAGRPPLSPPAPPEAGPTAEPVAAVAPEAVASPVAAADSGSSGTVAAALATVRAVPAPPGAAAASSAESATPVPEVASAAESAPEGTAPSTAPAFGVSIAGLPREPTPTVAPTAALALVATPTALSLQGRPGSLVEPTPARQVGAPGLSGTVTVGRGVSPQSSSTDLFSAPQPLLDFSAVPSTTNRPAANAASVPPGTLPQSVPPGGPVAGPPPGFAASPASPNNGPVAGAAAVGSAPLDATNATTHGVSILPPAAGASAGASLSAPRPQGATALSGTMVPSGVSQAAPAPAAAANRGAPAANRPR